MTGISVEELTVTDLRRPSVPARRNQPFVAPAPTQAMTATSMCCCEATELRSLPMWIDRAGLERLTDILAKFEEILTLLEPDE